MFGAERAVGHQHGCTAAARRGVSREMEETAVAQLPLHFFDLGFAAQQWFWMVITAGHVLRLCQSARRRRKVIIAARWCSHDERPFCCSNGKSGATLIVAAHGICHGDGVPGSEI